MVQGESFGIPAVARRLGCTLKYVYDLVYSGRLPAQKICGLWQISAEAVEAHLKRRGQR